MAKKTSLRDAIGAIAPNQVLNLPKEQKFVPPTTKNSELQEKNTSEDTIETPDENRPQDLNITSPSGEKITRDINVTQGTLASGDEQSTSDQNETQDEKVASQNVRLTPERETGSDFEEA